MSAGIQRRAIRVLTTFILSGGSWLISSLLANYNDEKLANPVDLANDVWNLESNLLVSALVQSMPPS